MEIFKITHSTAMELLMEFFSSMGSHRIIVGIRLRMVIFLPLEQNMGQELSVSNL